MPSNATRTVGGAAAKPWKTEKWLSPICVKSGKEESAAAAAIESAERSSLASDVDTFVKEWGETAEVIDRERKGRGCGERGATRREGQRKRKREERRRDRYKASKRKDEKTEGREETRIETKRRDRRQKREKDRRRGNDRVRAKGGRDNEYP